MIRIVELIGKPNVYANYGLYWYSRCVLVSESGVIYRLIYIEYRIYTSFFLASRLQTVYAQLMKRFELVARENAQHVETIALQNVSIQKPILQYKNLFGYFYWYYLKLKIRGLELKLEEARLQTVRELSHALRHSHSRPPSPRRMHRPRRSPGFRTQTSPTRSHSDSERTHERTRSSRERDKKFQGTARVQGTRCMTISCACSRLRFLMQQIFHSSNTPWFSQI